MIPLLANIPARLKTLTDRLTAARASNLDNIDSTTMGRLDVAVSSVGLTRKTQTFTSGGTWTRPTGVDSVRVILVGAGGGGGGLSTAFASEKCGGGGGGGQVIECDLTVTNDLTIAIGSGGAGGAVSTTTTGNRGASGGNSTITGGASLTAYGGTGGGTDNPSASRPGVDGNGNTGGGGSYVDNYTAGGGGGAGGKAPARQPPTAQNSIPGIPVYGHRGQAAGQYGDEHSSGVGKLGYGGGGTGGHAAYDTNHITHGGHIGTPSDGGGFGGYRAAGGDAVANTGGGGGGASNDGSTSYAGGDGADGLCIITWWE